MTQYSYILRYLLTYITVIWRRIEGTGVIKFYPPLLFQSKVCVLSFKQGH